MKEFGKYTGKELDNIQCFLTYNGAHSQRACDKALERWEKSANFRRLSTSEAMRLFSRDLAIHWWIRDRLSKEYALDRRYDVWDDLKPFASGWVKTFWERLETLRRRTGTNGDLRGIYFELRHRTHADVVFIERALKLFIILGSLGFPDLDKWTNGQL